MLLQLCKWHFTFLNSAVFAIKQEHESFVCLQSKQIPSTSSTESKKAWGSVWQQAKYLEKHSSQGRKEWVVCNWFLSKP